MKNRQKVIKKLKSFLDSARLRHCLRAEKIALKLGKKYNANLQKLSLAALLHDCARRYSSKELLAEAKNLGLSMDPVRIFEPKLFHAEISAHLAKTSFGIRDKAVLRAIKNHTIGSVKMTLLDKIIYLSDHIEEGRRFRGAKIIRKLAFSDLDRAILESLENMLLYLLKNKLPVYPNAIKVRNHFLLNQ